MTVPGRGGRPRKWRSDADRQRAFRARRDGRPEPPTLAQALDEGDELALAWERTRELQDAVERERERARDATSAAREARAELERERRLSRQQAAHAQQLAKQLAAAEEQRSLLATRLRELEGQLDARRAQGQSQSPGQPAPSRAERRRQERLSRRRKQP